jgi:hypothetical protein
MAVQGDTYRLRAAEMHVIAFEQPRCTSRQSGTNFFAKNLKT